MNEPIPEEDRNTKYRSVYDATAREIFWRQFLTGFSRALGSVVVYFVVFVIGISLISRYLWPSIEPYVTQYTQALDMFMGIQSSPQPSGTPIYMPSNAQMDQVYQRYFQNQPQAEPGTP